MKNKANIIKIIIIGIVSIVSILLVLDITKLDLIPGKYLIPITFGIILINIIGHVLLLIKSKITNIISFLIYIPIIAFSIMGSKVVNTADDFLDKAFDNYKTETIHYNVIVRANEYKSLSELNGKDIGYFTFYNDQDKMLNIIKNEIENVELKPYDDIYDTFVNFFANHITALIVDEGYFEEMYETYPDLDNKVTILYTYEIETKIENKEESTTTTTTNKKGKITTTKKVYPKIDKGESINIYISGSDSRKKVLPSKTRSDVNMVLSINPTTKTILMTSIPRDYYVWVYGKYGIKDKLTHAGIYGLNVSKKTVENLFNIDIDYAIKVGMPAVVELVDLVGGIEVYSDTEFDSYHIKGWHVIKGMNTMDGKHALAYARERYAYKSGDRHRIKNQQQVLEATFKKIASDKSILLKYEELLNTLKNFYMTDIPRDVISKYVKMQLSDMASWKFISQSVDGTGAMKNTYVTPKSKLYVMIPNESSVENARNKMKEVLEAR